MKGSRIEAIARELSGRFSALFGAGSRSQRGQASILIAIIFQVLFIFFAMVINVGLLVNDKINLQNSVDIAAYYGAMKQAEVLNAMGHLNYEIHATYKLFNYRVWALGNAGRGGIIPPGAVNDLQDHEINYTGGYKLPVVCIINPLWWDVKSSTKNQQNLCTNFSTVPALNPLPLEGFQLLPSFAGFLSIFAAQSATNASLFNENFKSSGSTNFDIAMRFIASYKVTVAKKRAAMQALQQLLIGGAAAPFAGDNDFSDVAGQSVKGTIEKIITKNLTAANKKGLGDIEFLNSLGGKPFLVPIEVRNFVKYADMSADDTGGYRVPTDVNTPPKQNAKADLVELSKLFWAPDYLGKFPPPSAKTFALEQDPIHNFNSLVGFEKDPWTLAYVRVYAESHPKMLFSPFVSGDTKSGTITLRAEAYAMPFGGRIGPWYFDSWAPGASASQSSNPIDGLLPPRVDMDFKTYDIPPNYSRFPGDQVGMQSALFQNMSVAAINTADIEALPHFAQDDYVNLDTNPDNSQQDPVVFSNRFGGSSAVRAVEIAALAPNLFDAVYYSISPNFYKEYGADIANGTNLLNKVCLGHCFDLGTHTDANGPVPMGTTEQLATANKFLAQGWWFLKQPEHLLSSWTQESTDNYVGNGPTKIGKARSGGGRTGYSVKIVSKEFLNRDDLPFGGGGGKVTGPLNNNPSKLGL